MSRAPQPEEYLALPYAGVGLRVFGAILDVTILASIFLVVIAASGIYLLTQTNWGTETTYTNSKGYLALVIVGLYAFVVPLYFFILRWWRGQTVGQMAVRIMVTDRDGDHLFDREGRALPDVSSGTVVLELP